MLLTLNGIRRPATIAAISFVMLLEGCHAIGHSVLCRDSVNVEVLSPDQRSKAVVVNEDCGATEADTVVELRRNRSWFAGQRIAFETPGTQPLRVTWPSNERLEVIAPKCDASKVQIQNWQGVTVSCKTEEKTAD